MLLKLKKKLNTRESWLKKKQKLKPSSLRLQHKKRLRRRPRKLLRLPRRRLRKKPKRKEKKRRRKEKLPLLLPRKS